MSEFIVNRDMFGLYAKIPTDYAGGKHIYKIVNRHMSNSWCETPITYESRKNPIPHKNIEEVLNVIHCGIDEREVITVALKDCEVLNVK